MVLTCHDWLPLSSPPGDGSAREERCASAQKTSAWHFLAKWFYGSGLAAAVNAVRCSGSASTAIADSAIAALLVGQQHDFSSVVAPTAGISAVRRADWT